MNTPKINILSTQLANMIAAGEVVERPSSVIKELMENSIDAQATRIEVHLKNAGRTSIEIIDNGIGMNQDDLSLAIQRHATSKILNEHDLFRIKTLGFRGEALPAIASVSELTITSSTGEVGYQVTVKDGEESYALAPARKGTIVHVKELFYNTPARLKYLKNDYIETSSCIDVVTRVALAFPLISVLLTIDEKEVFSTSGNGQLLSIIQTIFGQELATKLIPFQQAYTDVKVEGFLGQPEISKSHRYGLYTFVNGRSVVMPKINQAILEAYKPFLPMMRYPVVYLKFTIDPSLLDVNVHPAKREIRFSKEDLIKKILLEDIQKTLQASNLAAHPTFKQSEVIQPLVLQESKEEEIAVIEQLSLPFEPAKQTTLKVIGQLHALYIICEDLMGGIYLIDQHAAHERVNYEKNLSMLKENRHRMEPLIPLLIDLNPAQTKRLTPSILSRLESVGVVLESFGGNSFKVMTVPTWVNAQDHAQLFIEDLLIQLMDDANMDEDKLRLYAIATHSCKTSIKANQSLTILALQSLVDQLFLCTYPYSCPHGRPTMIQWSKYQLEKMFNRTGF
jgi:DNA mismatch repair protein MutL